MFKERSISVYFIFALFLAFIGYILYAANTGRALFFFEILECIPMGDKLVHLIFMGTLAFLLNLTLNVRTCTILGMPMLLGSLIAVGFVTIEEFSQMYIPTRNFDWMDLMANYIGIAWASKWQVPKSRHKIPNSN